MLDAQWNHTQDEIFICEIVLFRSPIQHAYTIVCRIWNSLEWIVMKLKFVWFDAEHLIAGPVRNETEFGKLEDTLLDERHKKLNWFRYAVCYAQKSFTSTPYDYNCFWHRYGWIFTWRTRPMHIAQLSKRDFVWQKKKNRIYSTMRINLNDYQNVLNLCLIGPRPRRNCDDIKSKHIFKLINFDRDISLN